MRRTDITVVGGGFAGFWAAIAAKRVGGLRTGVAVVSRSPYLEVRPRLYQSNPASRKVDLRPLLDRVGVDLHLTVAEDLDLDAGTLGTSSGPIAFERLVVATGSTMSRPAVAGSEQGYSIDNVADAATFDATLGRLARRGGGFTIVVIGGGFTGLELVLELGDRVEAFRAGAAQSLRAVLVDRGNDPGQALGPGPREVIEAALSEAAVDLRLGATVEELVGRTVLLSSGHRIAADAVVFTTGTRAADFVRLVPGVRDSLGRVEVDHHLKIRGDQRVFVAGDAARAVDDDGRVVLQSCQHALQMGRFAGENAALSLQGKALSRYRQPPYVTCLDLGRSGAVYAEGWDRRVVHTGARAKAIKTMINTTVIHPPEQGSARELLAQSVPVVHRW